MPYFRRSFVKRLLVLVLSLAGVLLFASLPGHGADAAGTQTQRPLLECADVDGNGPVSVGDVGVIVAKFGKTTGQPGFHFMYEVGAVDGAIAVGDIGGVVSDFGLNCAVARPDTQIARATMWSIGVAPPDVMSQSDCDTPANPSPPLTENMAALGAVGYYRASFDVPGQGVHYIKGSNWEDNTFDPCRPEGLVYINAGGALAALLYVNNGDAIGWGGFGPPGPVNQVNVDTFCSPQPCSWTSAAGATYSDGFHIHFNLCTRHIGMVDASAIPSIPEGTCNAGDDSDCTNPAVTDCNRWDDMTGWMGHMWAGIPNPNINPHDVSGNGRFADCLPDGAGWKAFNCPQ
jgi:hypothetical protein